MVDIKQKIKAVIFDMDGTILQTEHLWRQATYDILTQYNVLNLTLEQQKVLAAVDGMELVTQARVLKENFNLPGTPEELAHLKVANAMSNFKNKVNFIDGFESFQKKLVQNNIPHGIATNAHKGPFSIIIETMKLNQFFGQHLYCTDDVQNRSKPDPALFLFVAKQLGVKPEECIVFEDTVQGFQAAQAAGMKCIAIENENNKDFLHFANGSVKSYDQAEDLINNL